MSKVTVRLTPTGTWIEIEAETPKDAFKQASAYAEVFGEKHCAVCGCKDLRYQVRTHDDNDYYELVCTNQECRCTLGFGQHKTGGTLFAKRWDKEKRQPIGTNGWKKWERQPQQSAPSQPQEPSDSEAPF